MNQRIFSALFLLIVLGIHQSHAIKVVNMQDGGFTAANLVNALIGPGILVDQASVTFKGSPHMAGLFTDATVEGQGNQYLTKSGIAFSTGFVDSLNSNANTSNSMSGSIGVAGDNDLNSLLKPGGATFDASVLEFDFEVTGEGDVTASFWYIFGSDEYNSFVGSDFTDVFGFFLDGTNIATIPGTTTPVAINTVNSITNPTLFNNNELASGSPFATQMDGFTKPLFSEFTVKSGTKHHLKLAIADVTDPLMDSWILMGGNSFVTKYIPEDSTLSLVLVGFCILLSYAYYSRKQKPFSLSITK